MGKIALLSALAAFLLTAITLKLLIPLLKRLKMGQKILEIGPAWHIAKQGTPTMGGLAFLICVPAVCLVFTLLDGAAPAMLLTLSFALVNGLIGVADDLIKMKRKQNEGFSAFTKFLLQLIAASGYLVLCAYLGLLSTELYIPFWGQSIDIGRLYYPFALIMLTGFTNAVNLTDGLDGLCSSVTSAVCLFLAVMTLRDGENALSVLSLAVLGTCFGFLIFNFHPASVFMGDTGSLFLGGAVSGLALISGKNTVLLVVGGVYLLEAVSVILQVLYYKLTKKRLFLMAPFHHHLEKKGMSEVKITLLMTAVTLALAGISYLFI